MSVASIALVAFVVVAVSVGLKRGSASPDDAARSRGGPWPAMVVVGFAVLALSATVGGMALFGLNTTCTNQYDCTDDDCAPCRPLVMGAMVFVFGEPVLAASVVYAHSRVAERRRGWLVLPVGTLLAVGFAAGMLWWMVWWTGVNT